MAFAEGDLRESMTALIEALRLDPILIENQCAIVYSLDHPTKRIVVAAEKFTLNIQPTGFSQVTGRGDLTLQYFFWISIKCKPSTLGIDEQDRLTFLAEHICNFVHAHKWGNLWTYLGKSIINLQSFELTTNSRNVRLDLARDEIGVMMMFWQTRKKEADETDPTIRPVE